MRKLVEFTAKDWNKHALMIRYKRSKFEILYENLPAHIQEQLDKHDPMKYNINGYVYLDKREFIPETLVLSFNHYGIPVLLHEYKSEPVQYAEYRYYKWGSMTDINVQRNGFFVYCAPTGQGKTYFAIDNLEKLSKQFDTILYINLELSINDIYNRCIEHNMQIPKNVYIEALDNVEVIKEWAEDKGQCAFIVDNIDNLIGGANDPYEAQREFMKQFDRFLKDYNHHALVLTQLVKDNKQNLIAKDGEIEPSITVNVLSGVKQLSYLSRSVMMTAYSPTLEQYVYKILKVGSAKI